MVVICVTILASQAAITGAFLLWKGYAGGGELVVTLNTAISGLIGFLGGRATTPVNQPDAPPGGTSTTTTSSIPTTTFTQPVEKPVEASKLSGETVATPTTPDPIKP